VGATTDSTLYVGELEIRLSEGLVLATGQALTLSVREFELLAALAARTGAIVTREELFGEIWGGELRPGDRSVDVYVSKLRGKLEAALPDRRFIHTHPGFGYRFQPQPAREGIAASSQRGSSQTRPESIVEVAGGHLDEQDTGQPADMSAA
jgi:DNA-binding response OmpR family regulator